MANIIRAHPSGLGVRPGRVVRALAFLSISPGSIPGAGRSTLPYITISHVMKILILISLAVWSVNGLTVYYN